MQSQGQQSSVGSANQHLPIHPSQVPEITARKHSQKNGDQSPTTGGKVNASDQLNEDSQRSMEPSQNKKLLPTQKSGVGQAPNKKSTADLIRQRLNISSPSKKKPGQQGFSHSDEMQYKRTTVLRDFQIMSKLGDGAYSSVYKVKRLEDGQIYALKKVKIGMMSSKDKENAINEVRILSSVKHPNVVAYKEAFIDNESQTLNLVMQLADGGDLLKMISDRKRRKVHFRESQVWRVLIETVYGLRAMHELSVMHRDIKSANIFLFRNSQEEQSQGGNLYQAKLGDMNVSKVTQSNGLNYTQTGTPYYASPEVWKDEPYGFKSDVWSLGCVIYEMLSLKPPFSGRDMDHLYKRVCKGVYPRIPEHYSNDIWAIVQLMLQVNPEKRPDCNSLIQSKMFQIYSDKLNSLESVDRTFQKTLKSCSPDRAEIKMITNSLLTQLHLPINDLSQISGVLPRRNYESAQGQAPKGGSLLKSTTAQDEMQSNSSRKVSKLRNQQQQSRQKTQLQQPGILVDTNQTQNDSIVEHAEPSVFIPQSNSKGVKQTPLKHLNKQSISPTPKMTKIQSKLQRQYLQQQGANSSLMNDQVTNAGDAINRSLNPTMITNRSGSKQSLLKPVNLNDSDTAGDRDHQLSLRNRLSSKRKQVYQQVISSIDEKDGQLVDRVVSQRKNQPPTEKKATSVIKGGNMAAYQNQDAAAKYGSYERNGQNLSPLKVDENRIMLIGNQQQSAQANSLKQTRLSLPQVSLGAPTRDRSIPVNSIPDSASQTPSNAPLAIQLRGSETVVNDVAKNSLVMSLPQLSEVDSDKMSPPQLRSRRDEYGTAVNPISLKSQLNKDATEKAAMPNFVKLQQNQQNAYQIAQNESSDGQYLLGSGGASPQESIKQGKRHASFDVLVSPNNASQQMLQPHQKMVSPMMPAQLIASQNILVPQQTSDLGAKSTRMPESQSYSQINVMSKAQLGISTGKGKVSTSDSEEQNSILRSQPSVPHKGDLKLKHQLINRFTGPAQALSSQNATMLSLDHRVAQPRPSVHSQVHETSKFSKNQQNSVRHVASDKNFSLNSDELRHGNFQLAHLNGGQAPMSNNLPLMEDNFTNSTRRKGDITNSAIKLPHIEQRKKSYDSRTVRDPHNVAVKLSASLKNSGVASITKKKPVGTGVLPAQQSAHYYSIVPNSSTNMTVSLAQTMATNNANMVSLQSVGSGSPIHQQVSMTIKNTNTGVATQKVPITNQQQTAQIAIKKKTLAAYANTRARNPRNNLIYTQKHNSAAQQT